MINRTETGAQKTDLQNGLMRRAISILLLAAGLAGAVQASVDIGQPATADQRERYLTLVEELRCPKCQNQNLADSDSPIAADLRREIRRLLEAGNSDQQIIDFLVARYGEFILYRPAWREHTYLLWLAPAALLGVGLMGVALVVRQRRVASSSPQSTLEDAEIAVLRQLLDQDGKPGGDNSASGSS